MSKTITLALTEDETLFLSSLVAIGKGTVLRQNETKLAGSVTIAVLLASMPDKEGNALANGVCAKVAQAAEQCDFAARTDPAQRGTPETPCS